MAALVAFAGMVLASTGCGGSALCYAVSSACVVTCDALPGQTFSGTMTASGFWTSGDPASIPVSTIDGMCRSGSSQGLGSIDCFAATPGLDREAQITCACQPWTVTNDEAPCPSFSWK